MPRASTRRIGDRRLDALSLELREELLQVLHLESDVIERRGRRWRPSASVDGEKFRPTARKRRADERSGSAASAAHSRRRPSRTSRASRPVLLTEEVHVMQLDRLRLRLHLDSSTFTSSGPSTNASRHGPGPGFDDVAFHVVAGRGFLGGHDAEAIGFHLVERRIAGSAPRSRCGRHVLPLLPPFAACVRMKIQTFGILITSRLSVPTLTTVPPSASAQNFLCAAGPSR